MTINLREIRKRCEKANEMETDQSFSVVAAILTEEDLPALLDWVERCQRVLKDVEKTTEYQGLLGNVKQLLSELEP